MNKLMLVLMAVFGSLLVGIQLLFAAGLAAKWSGIEGLLVLGLVVAAISATIWAFFRGRVYAWVFATMLWLVPTGWIAFSEWDFNQAEARFKHLCATQAGEKIYKTVQNVEGILLAKPRKYHGVDDVEDQFRWEDPYGSVTDALNRSSPGRPYYKIYQYVELPFEVTQHWGQRAPFGRLEVKPSGKKVQKLEAQYAYGDKTYFDEYLLSLTPLDAPQANYAVIWEDINDPADRQRWIGGGRLIVKDLRKNEILAERTGYVFAYGFKNVRSAWSLAHEVPGRTCPKSKPYRESEFLSRVLIPRPRVGSFEQGGVKESATSLTTNEFEFFEQYRKSAARR